MAERTYSPVADNQAFALGVFQSLPWAALANNAQHIVANRGRMVGCELFNSRFFGKTPVEVARYVFDATPYETAYRVQPVIAVAPIANNLDITVLIESEDSAGGNTASDTYTYQWRRPEGGGNDYGQVARHSESILNWPFEDNELLGGEVFYLPWYEHEVNASLPTINRTIKLTLSAASTHEGLIIVTSRGAGIVGYRIQEI